MQSSGDSPSYLKHEGYESNVHKAVEVTCPGPKAMLSKAGLLFGPNLGWARRITERVPDPLWVSTATATPQ